MGGIDISKIQTVSKKKSSVALGNKIFELLQKDIKLGSNEFNDKKKEAFYIELSTLLTAGVDIKTSLELIASEQAKVKDKIFFEAIKEKVIGGSTLSDAIKDSEKFSMYEYFSVQIGEETGKTASVLKDLSEFFGKKIKQKRQLVSVLSYPCIVLLTSFGAVAFMMSAVVPMFKGIFDRAGADLPWITLMVVRMSNFFASYLYLLLLFIMSLTVLIFSQRKQIWFRDITSRIVLRIPVLGDMVRKIYIARLCHFMTLLTGSKIPLLRAIDLIRQMIGFYPIETSLAVVEKDIMKGMSLHKSMSQFPIYYSKMITLIKIGEEVNQLESFFDKIAKQYSDDVEHQTTLIKSLIEPFIILFLAIVVGTIVVAMYLPLFKLSTVF